MLKFNRPGKRTAKDVAAVSLKSRMPGKRGNTELAYDQNVTFGTTISQQSPSGGAGPQSAHIGFVKNLEQSILEGYVNSNEPKSVRQICRDMYYHDPICGGTVDLVSTIPFGDFSLTGITNAEILSTYIKSCERLRVKTLMPLQTASFLTDGVAMGALNFNEQEKIFDGTILLNPDDCEIKFMPMVGQTPVINAKIADELKEAAQIANNPYVRQSLETLSKQIKALVTGGNVELEEGNTLYIPRRALSHHNHGTSLFQRLIPIYLMEKSLLRGTIELAHRRQRGILHIQVGDDEWIAQPDEMQAIGDYFTYADRDPLGAVVVTRNSVMANEVQCLSGGTLISTDQGLMRMDEFIEHDPRKLIPGTSFETDIKVKNDKGEFAPVYKWWFNGFKETVIVKSKQDSFINCTKEHKFLTIGDKAELELIEAKHLKEGSLVLLDSKKVRTKHDLKLYLNKPEVINRPDNSDFVLPTIMTPELAYSIGIIISEGCITKKSVMVSNTNKDILQRYILGIEKSFNVKGSVYKTEKDTGIILGKTYKLKDMYASTFSSKKLVNTLIQLGLSVSSTLRTDRSPSYNKEVPWCIMQANSECQLAFLSAYLDGDRSAPKSKRNFPVFKWVSTSRKILTGIRLILLQLGYSPSHFSKRTRTYKGSNSKGVRLNTKDTLEIAEEMPLSFKAQTVNNYKGDRKKYQEGIPSSVFVPFLKSRCLGRVRENGEDGTGFITDEVKRIVIPGGWDEYFRKFLRAGVAMHYDAYDRGEYDKLFSLMEKVSPIFAENMRILMERRYKIEQISQVVRSTVKPVYDLTMDHSVSAPLYIANGIVVKNSGGDFWRHDMGAESYTNLKFKALGVSENSLSGDMSISSNDNSMTSFIQKVRGHREAMTQEYFYDKIFPVIAVANEFKKEEHELASRFDTEYNTLGYFKEISSPYGRRIFKSESGYRGVVNQRTFHVSELAAGIGKNEDISEYQMPKLVWHNSLRPEGSREFLDMLTALEEKGVPVAMRRIAAAGGLSVEDIIQGAEGDIELRQAFKEIADKLKEISPQAQDAGAMYAAAEALENFQAMPKGLVGAINRDYGDLSKDSFVNDHGPKHIRSSREQKRLEEEANKRVAREAVELAKKLNKERTETIDYAKKRGANDIFGK